jgi:AsmA-like C-terminal region
MYRLHLTRNLRTLAFFGVIAAVIAGVGVLWWANHTGLPAPWRAAIEREAGKQGAHIRIGSLRYSLLRGITATDVLVYSDAAHQQEISRLERIILDFDKTKLARGQFHLNRIQLADARLILPVDPKDPDSRTLNVTGADGTIFMPGDRRIEVRGARGRIAGIDVELDARIIAFRADGGKQQDDDDVGKRRELLANVIQELEKWNFRQEQPPVLRISVDGDVNDHSTLRAKVTLEVKDMEKNGHMLDEVSAEADLAGDVLTISSLKASDAKGVFEGHVDYNLKDREGRFDVNSSLEVPALLKAWLGLPGIRDITIGGRQSLEARGGFELDERNVPHFRTTGLVKCEAVTLKGMSFDSVESAFSWMDGDLFLRDILLERKDGRAEGKAMIEWPLVRLQLHSTLPVPVYRPFFVNQPLGKVLDDFSERDGASVDVTLEGGFDGTNRHAWAYKGFGSVKNLNYKGVPVNAAQSKFSLNHQELDFHEATVDFNYSKYALRDAFGGPTDGQAKVGRIRYNAPEKLVEVENVSGSIWAAPMVRLFAAKVADSLEQYRFHRPPEMKASGVVDVTPRGRTSLDISFRSETPADYRFLGENLTLASPSGLVAIRGPRVTVEGLKVGAFDGPVVARIDYVGNGKLEGEVSWTRLSLPDVASAYGFELKGRGTATGRLDFSLTDGDVATMDGEGLLALEKAELFSVPMFGPLTPLIGGVLNDERAGFQRAKNAFCTFRIRDGILSSNDFQTATTSLNFTGEGSLDMNNRTVDMTMRMNARGWLGFITLPLRPFSGLFQFRGTGPMKDTKWESMKFTAPPESQEETLLSPPKARVVGSPE